MFGAMLVAVASSALASSALASSALASSALAYSGAVKGACRADYKRFCAAHAVDDPGLRRCMDKAGHSLSRTCVAVLINSGEVSKSRAAQRWGHEF
ncbi:hypothetical protein AUC68_09650 [Methyloceanibacter methanicus]|uniref:Cysteine rich repeat protein n=1 Tax=Methyloceanibacter methanicus TaxID=1774968 RepID=A0A1E3VYQ1_9HYPH|nr:hypothetical protein AUC68_09650 [Methyloceanibacter methanicus]